MSRTFQRVLVAVVSLAVAVAPFAGGAALADPACGLARGAWTTIPAPRFPAGPQWLTAYEVDAAAPARIFVTNGISVMRTVDGACSWKQVFVLPEVPSAESQATAENARILEIEIARQLRTRTVLRIHEGAPQGGRPHIVLSDDGGGTWRSGDVGLPPAGIAEDLMLHPANPDHAYLAVDIGGGSVDSLFASTDGGQTWTLRSNPASMAQTSGIVGLEPDPLVATVLWAFGPGGLYKSTDSGATFTAIGEFSGSRVSTVDVFHADGPARIAGFRPDHRDARWSENDGATWLSVSTPPEVTSSATTGDPNDVFVTAQGKVWAFHSASFSWLDLKAPNGDLQDISTDAAGDVYAMSPGSIEVVTPPARRIPVELPDDVFEVPLVNPPTSLQRHPPTLQPEGRKIRLDPGESRTVRYQLGLPERPLPLNVFFLLDTSDSMGATIGDLAQSVADIINQLNTEKLSLKVGIGAFRAYPDRFPPRPACDEQPDVQSCEKNYVFRNILDITDPGPAVTTALETLESDAGGFYKSHLGALFQLATGQGQDLFPPGPAGHDVPPGLQANFDDNSLRVVIHATDEAFGDDVRRDSGGTDFGNPDPPEIPEFSEVAEAFNARDIMQVGLAIGRGAKSDLERVAGDTGAVAPAVGVDCGKGYFIPAGEPLVCPVSRNNLTQSHNLVPAIVNILKAVPESADVSLSVKGNDRIIQKVTPELHEDIVLQVARGLSFDVTYRCPADLAGKSFPIDVSTRAEGDVLDAVDTQVVCRAVPKRPPVPPIVPPLVALGVMVAVPPPPPPPLSNLTSASQAQSQAQAQTGAVFEEEKEPQLAIAAAYREAMQEENAYEFEMVAYESRQDQVSPYLTLGTGAVMASMFYAGVMISRQRGRVALQRQRRRR